MTMQDPAAIYYIPLKSGRGFAFSAAGIGGRGL
jgi:hypothetical protein